MDTNDNEENQKPTISIGCLQISTMGTKNNKRKIEKPTTSIRCLQISYLYNQAEKEKHTHTHTHTGLHNQVRFTSRWRGNFRRKRKIKPNSQQQPKGQNV